MALNSDIASSTHIKEINGFCIDDIVELVDGENWFNSSLPWSSIKGKRAKILGFWSSSSQWRAKIQILAEPIDARSGLYPYPLEPISVFLKRLKKIDIYHRFFEDEIKLLKNIEKIYKQIN